jgi:imidazolonepropionase
MRRAAPQDVDVILLNAGELLTCAGPRQGIAGDALRSVAIFRHGALAIRAGRIAAVGTTAEIESRYRADRVIDAAGALVSPGFVDPHSHLLHGGTRHQEYESKITGSGTPPGLQSGINFTVRQTRKAPDDRLVSQALSDLDTMLEHGTTTLEAKTGYGLDRDTELRLLHLTAGLDHPIDVVTTYLGAHVLPADFADRRADYLDLVIDLLPEAARLAEYCDVCCDPVSFTFDECLRVGEAASRLGMGIRVHADQTGDARGALLAARLNAVSADHLDYTTDEGFAAMAEAGTVGILFPGVTLHMCEMTPKPIGGRLVPAEKPFMPLVARRAVESGCTIALSTDYNPGSCPTPSMQMVMQLAARLFRLSYAEIWNMCTLNAAVALGRGHDRGSLEPGKRADIVIWKVPEHGLVINRFGVNLVETVLVEGEVVVAGGRTVHPSVPAFQAFGATPNRASQDRQDQKGVVA